LRYAAQYVNAGQRHQSDGKALISVTEGAGHARAELENVGETIHRLESTALNPAIEMQQLRGRHSGGGGRLGRLNSARA